MKSNLKQYCSLVWVLLLILAIWYTWYRSFKAYRWEHLYYDTIVSSYQNWWIVFAAIACAFIFPILYFIVCSKVNLKKLIVRLWLWAWTFWLLHSIIKLIWSWTRVMWFWNLIIIFHTLLLFFLWVYLICGFAALWSWIERKIVKFKQWRRQEMLLSFWIWLCWFIVIVQLLLWIWALYWIVSRALFLGLWFMIWYERENLKKREETIVSILENFKTWITSANISHILLLILLVVSLWYLYMWIQNAFTPYSTAWDANHDYMYFPKILAENAWIYRWNSVGNNMPWVWHQFLTFIFSLTGCTNWWLWLSSDNIAISMNNLSTSFVLIFWVAIIFQLFSLLASNKKESEESDKVAAKKWKKWLITVQDLSNSNWIIIWWTTLLLWLTSWMWAFLVIVDNKTDLWVMAISLLALLSGLIFLQNRWETKDNKELLKYIIVAWLLFGFAALAKITAFVDLALFWLLLVWLWFSPIMSLGLWIMVMWLVRKFNILTSSVMLTSTNATWFIMIWLTITVIWLILILTKEEKRKNIWTNFYHLIVLWICFVVPFLLFKLPWTTISQIKTNTYSVTNSLKAVFLSYNTENKDVDNYKLLAQNVTTEENNTDEESDSRSNSSLDEQDLIDLSIINTNKQPDFFQCSKEWNIYSEEELNKDLQEVVWDWAAEDLWRYIGYWWKQFTWENNWFFWLMKLLWPSSDTCYGLNNDAKVLCNNSGVIESFKIEDIRAIYENWISNQNSEAWLLLNEAINAYDEAKKAWKLSFVSSNNSALFYDEIVSLRQYYQSHSILSESWSVYIPYRYLVPLNISFNRSLQNLSSYYTDIWFIWVILYILLIIALPYAAFKKDKPLIAISLTTLIWWWIWRIIWSAILWYGTVLISWTMITVALFWDRLLKKEDDVENLRILPWILTFIVFIIFIIQILLNFARIASQWASSVFVWYKSSVGKEQIIDENLEATEKIKYWYWRKNIFDLQFPQYNPIINALANRKNEDWVIVAWTYIQYFLWNQWNIKSDWMLSDFWVKTSDWDLCKTYWRLRNNNTRYLIVDPNIWTVTMWEWNETLFYRFFGKLNNTKTEIELDGTITTLVRLARAWYLKLLSTNNIWSKYAFVVDDNTIREYFWANLTDEQIILTRAKMAVLQYFDDADSIFQSIWNIFMTRIMYDTVAWVEDIANIYGLEIDSEKVASAAYNYINWKNTNVEWLSQNERAVLINYLNIYLAYQNWDNNNAWSMVQNLLVNSVSWWSQVIALELN